MKCFVLLILFLNLNVHAQDAWRCHVIDNAGSGADGVKLADINNDGSWDITTGWEESGVTKVYFHPKASAIKKNWPHVTIGKTPNVEDAVFADVNNDGDLDVVSCTENHSQKVFVHFNPGNKKLLDGPWVQKVLPASDGLMSWMYAEAVQLDRKNGPDLVAAGKGKNAAIGWFEAPKDGNDLTAWKWHEISKVGWIMSIILEDMDKDGDPDVVISDRNGKLCGCRWLENPGANKMQQSAWKNHFVGAQDMEVMFMCLADLDGDKEKEILVSERSNNTLLVFKKENGQWQKHTIKLPAFTGKAKSVEVGDMNGDGIKDLVVSTNTLNTQKHGLIWLDGNCLYKSKETNWRSISGLHKAKYDKVELLDIDNDGDLDVLICEENYGKSSEGLGVVWYENPAN